MWCLFLGATMIDECIFLRRSMFMASSNKTRVKPSVSSRNIGQGADDTPKSAVLTSSCTAITLSESGVITLTFHAKPNAKQTSILSISDEQVEIQIAASPKDGEANAELVRYLATTLDVRRSRIVVERGSKSRLKTITISSDAGISLEDVAAKLKAACSSPWLMSRHALRQIVWFGCVSYHIQNQGKYWYVAAEFWYDFHCRDFFLLSWHYSLQSSFLFLSIDKITGRPVPLMKQYCWFSSVKP